MKLINYLSIIFVIILLAACGGDKATSNGTGGKTVLFSQLEVADGIVKYNGTPFTGKARGADSEKKTNEILEYKDGKKVTRSFKNPKTNYTIKDTFYPNGKIKNRKTFNSINKLAKEIPFNQKGKMEGKVKTYYTNGKIKKIETYKLGKKNGQAIYYGQDGKVKKRETYRNGKKVNPNKKKGKGKANSKNNNKK